MKKNSNDIFSYSCSKKNYLRVPSREFQSSGHQKLDSYLSQGIANVSGDGQLRGLSDQSSRFSMQMVSRFESVQHRHIQKSTRLAGEGLRSEKYQK